MDDLISRQAAIDALNMQAEEMSHWSERYQEQRRGVLTAVNIIVDCPSAEPEREKGEWVYNSPVSMKCNRCGLVIKDWDWHRFKICPNCGAKMEGERKE